MSDRKWKFFLDDEVTNLDPGLVEKLDQAREIAGVPFLITRGFSTPEQNQECGGVHDSAHLVGKAVDLSAADSMARFLIAKGLIAVGFNRIGIYARHIHADIDGSLPQNVAWISDKG